jgi:hypothetical protein
MPETEIQARSTGPGATLPGPIPTRHPRPSNPHAPARQDSVPVAGRAYRVLRGLRSRFARLRRTRFSSAPAPEIRRLNRSIACGQAARCSSRTGGRRSDGQGARSIGSIRVSASEGLRTTYVAAAAFARAQQPRFRLMQPHATPHRSAVPRCSSRPYMYLYIRHPPSARRSAACWTPRRWQLYRTR